MAALALCGTAFGAEFSTSEYADKMFGEKIYMAEYEVNGPTTITVDSSAPTGKSGGDQYFYGGTTVDFVGSDSWYTKNSVAFFGGVNITSSGAAQSWLDALIAGEQITLFKNVTPGDGFNITSSGLRFNGVEKDGQVTLAGTELTFKGYKSNPNTLSLGDNEIAIVRMVENNKTTGYTLAGGNITSATTPEPATATLSLLALAGLASRRRRK